MHTLNRKEIRYKRKIRIKKKIRGTQDRPRLCVFRSIKHIDVQVINDADGVTIATASTHEKAIRGSQKFKSKIEAASYIGKEIGKRAIEKGIKQVVFDRNGFLYHGRVKAVSEGAREAGLDF